MRYQSFYSVDHKITDQLEHYSRQYRDRAFSDCVVLLSLTRRDPLATSTEPDMREEDRLHFSKHAGMASQPHHQLTADTVAAATAIARRRYNCHLTAAQRSTVTLKEPRGRAVVKRMAEFLRRCRVVPEKYLSNSYSQLHANSRRRRRRLNVREAAPGVEARRRATTATRRRRHLLTEITLETRAPERESRREIVQSPRRKFHFVGMPATSISRMRVDPTNGLLTESSRRAFLPASCVRTARVCTAVEAVQMINEETAGVERALALYAALKAHDDTGDTCTRILLDALPSVKKVTFADFKLPVIPDRLKTGFYLFFAKSNIVY